MVSPYDMSDEDFSNLPETPVEESEETSDVPDEDLSEEEAQEEVDEDDSSEEDETSTDESEEEDSSEESDEDEDESTEEEDSTDEESTDKEDDKDADKDDADAESDKDKEEKPKETNDEAASIVAKLFAPFQANGKQMSVDNIDDAITLMQQGANYSKKMAAIKPAMRLSTMLTNNGINEENLGFLIDLKNGDKGAIAKLVADSGIDPLEIDTEKNPGYRPNSHRVADEEVKLNDTLAGIADTPSYSKTVEVVSRLWDAKSREAAYKDPRIIEDINTHISNGTYDVVMERIERERSFGRLSGQSDIDAYANSYKQLNDERSNGEKAKQVSKQAQLDTKNLSASKAKVDAEAADKLKRRKKLAGGGKPKPAKTNDDADFNPFDMSDEEFEAATKRR